MNRNEKKVLLLCGAGHFIVHFYMLLFPTLALFLHEEMGLSLAETLNLAFWMYLFFGLFAVPLGYIGDRWKNRPMLVGMMFGIGAGCFLTGAATTPGKLSLGLAVIGFFAAIYHPVGMALISHTCKNRGQALGINGVWGNLGIGLGPLFAGLAGYFVGWQWTFHIYGGLTILLGVLLAFIKIDESLVERAGMNGNAQEGEGMLSYFVMMLACMALLGLSYRGTVVAIPAHFEASMEFLTGLFSMEGQLGTKKLGTAILVSAMYLFGTFGQVIGGRVADKWDLRKAYFLFHLGSLPCMLGIAYFTEVPLLIISLAYIFFGLGMQPIENSLVARLTPPHLRSIGYGLKFVLVLGFSAFSIKLVKWQMDHGDASGVFVAQSGVIAIVLVLFGAIWWKSRRQAWRNG
jgi:MFS family permease